MQKNKNKQSSTFHVRLKKYQSDPKFRYIQHHILNKSPTKNVPSFNTGSIRLLEPKSSSPDKFYNIPQFKTKKSASFGYGTKTNFVKKQFIDPTRYKISSSFQLIKKRKTTIPTFGISRQDFYKGKFSQTNQKIGPGRYNINLDKKNCSFYIGMKMKRNDQTFTPGPGTYNIRTNQSLQQLKSPHESKVKGPRLKTQYFEKGLLDKYDNKVPGPGAYNISSTSMMIVQKQINKKPKLPQCPRFKVKQQKIPPPGAYQPFSQFG